MAESLTENAVVVARQLKQADFGSYVKVGFKTVQNH